MVHKTLEFGRPDYKYTKIPNFINPGYLTTICCGYIFHNAYHAKGQYAYSKMF